MQNKPVHEKEYVQTYKSNIMERYIVKIRLIEKITHDVLRIVTEKPSGYTFTPGQATEVAINKPEWVNEKRPFTFTCLPDDDYLELIIKTYTDHKGVTNELLTLQKDDELIIHDVFGSILYQQEGIFIAGGAGITPFISILRNLHAKDEMRGNVLIFANKTKADIILYKEIEDMLGGHFLNVLSAEQVDGYSHGMITEDFLKSNIENFKQHFYVCGPPPMMEAVIKMLTNLHVDKQYIVREQF